MGRPRGTSGHTKPVIIGKAWYVRLYCTARVGADGKLVPITSKGKIALDEHGKAVRKQFAFRLGDVLKFKAKGAGLNLAVAQIKADLEAAESQIDSNGGADSTPEDMDVTRFFESVFMPYARHEKETATVESYKRFWSAYLSEHFNGRTLQAYEPHHATNFVESLCKRGLSANTVKQARAISSAIFAYATAKGYIPSNPWRDAKSTMSGKETEDGIAYAEPEVLRIIGALENHQCTKRERFTAETAEMVMIVGFYCGLRSSEIAGLTWDCIDIDRNAIRVKQAFVHGQSKGTKTGKERTVTVPALLAPQLNARLRLWRTKRPADGWVFPNERATGPISMQYLNRFINEVLEPLGMEYHGHYALRRGFGTRMMLLGLGPTELSQAMGNSVDVIMRSYFKDKDCKLAAGGMLRVAEAMQQEQRKQLEEEGQK